MGRILKLDELFLSFNVCSLITYLIQLKLFFKAEVFSILPALLSDFQPILGIFFINSEMYCMR